MLRFLDRTFLAGENRLNSCALILLALVAGFFHLNTDPDACGGDPVATARRSSPQLFPPVATPLPVQTASIQQAMDQVVTVSPETAELTGPPADASYTDPETADQKGTDPAEASPDEQPLTGITALKVSRKYLLNGKSMLERVPDYTATFNRQERISGCLLDPQAMTLKVRHEPFSLYMKWSEGDKGRQLIYVKGLNDDQVLVQPGGLTGRLTGTLTMAPDDPRVLAESRYPASRAGLLELTNTILKNHDTDIARGSGVECQMTAGESFDERPCYLTTLTYESPTVNADYHKSLILIDKAFSVPVCVKNYTWVDGKPAAEDGEDNLIEFYSYSGIEINLELSDNDFEKSKYRMR